MSRSGAAYLLSGQVLGTLLIAGHYYAPPVATRSTSVMSNNTMNAAGFYLPRAVRFDRIGAEVTGAGGAGSVIRLGMYADDGTEQPGALVVDAGTIDGTSVTAQQITINATVGPGIVWFVACAQGTPVGDPTMRCRTLGAWTVSTPTGVLATATGAQLNGQSRGGIAGALPDPFGGASNSNTSPIVVARAA